MDIACPNSFTRKTKFRFNAARQVNPAVDEGETNSLSFSSLFRITWEVKFLKILFKQETKEQFSFSQVS